MKNNITELVFILDRSGSMYNLTSDTIGGFNAMIDKQKQLDGKVLVTTVLFSDDSSMLHDRVDIKEVKPMTAHEYETGGCTALLDAIGETIHHITNIHRYARPEDVPEHTIFVITTDGLENASSEYSADRVRGMIKHEQDKYGWEFIFLAANIDAVETAEMYGIRRENVSNYRASSKGVEHMYDCACDAVLCMRADIPLSEDWNEELLLDLESPDDN